ncbi:MAG: hypothetical protein LBP24_01300 [Coriobacteriales bacterium]|jgi:hypothetical protein|nr:hypothetical protein [Coriobacteriales bacterium]
MKNNGKQLKTSKAIMSLLAMITFLVACLGLMGCTLSSEGWTEEQIVEANKKLMHKKLGIEEGAAQYNAELLAELGVGRIVEIAAGPEDELGVREITMKDDKGKVYWAPIDKVETFSWINENDLQGKTIYIITP